MRMAHPPQPHTVVTKRSANHGLHIVLTVLTCGIWAITGWPIAAAMGRKTKTTYAGPPPGYQQPPPGAYPYPPQQPGQHPYPPQGQQSPQQPWPPQ